VTVTTYTKLLVWDFRGGEAKMQFGTRSKVERGTQLRNGNVMLVYTHKGITYIEEQQVLR